MKGEVAADVQCPVVLEPAFGRCWSRVFHIAHHEDDGADGIAHAAVGDVGRLSVKPDFTGNFCALDQMAAFTVQTDDAPAFAKLLAGLIVDFPRPYLVVKGVIGDLEFLEITLFDNASNVDGTGLPISCLDRRRTGKGRLQEGQPKCASKQHGKGTDKICDCRLGHLTISVWFARDTVLRWACQREVPHGGMPDRSPVWAAVRVSICKRCPYWVQRTLVRSFACVGWFGHRPSMRASATVGKASWNR